MNADERTFPTENWELSTDNSLPVNRQSSIIDHQSKGFPLLRPIIGSRIRAKPRVVTGLGGCDVAEKLPVIIDNRGQGEGSSVNQKGNSR